MLASLYPLLRERVARASKPGEGRESQIRRRSFPRLIGVGAPMAEASLLNDKVTSPSFFVGHKPWRTHFLRRPSRHYEGSCITVVLDWRF